MLLCQVIEEAVEQLLLLWPEPTLHHPLAAGDQPVLGPFGAWRYCWPAHLTVVRMREG